jgi:hypothetical protein
MAGEQHERTVGAAGGAGEHTRVSCVADRHATVGQDLEDMLGDVSLCVGFRRDVDEPQRPLRQPACQVC